MPVVTVPDVKVFATGVWNVASTSGITRLIKSGNPKFNDRGFQIGHAVLYAAAPGQHLGS